MTTGFKKSIHFLKPAETNPGVTSTIKKYHVTKILHTGRENRVGSPLCKDIVIRMM